MKIVVTNVFGPLNRGDYELFKILLQLILKPGVEVSVIARDPDLCVHHFSEVNFYEQLGKATKGSLPWQLLNRVFYLLSCIFSVYIPSLTFCLPSSQSAAIEEIRKADLIIGCPGGFLEDSSFSLYSHLVQLLLPILLKRKVILAPMSIGPISNFLPRIILKFILKRADRVYVREPLSKNFCEAIGTNCILSNDLAFLNIMDELGENNENYRIQFIAATVINWNFPKSTNSNYEKYQYIHRMIETLNKLHQRTKLPVKLIVQVESDLPVIDKVKSRLSAPCEILYDVTTPEEIKNILKKSFCLIASRFHSAIFALCVGCPVIALSYLPKTAGMLELYGIKELCRPIDEFDPEELSATLFKMGCSPEIFAAKSDELKRGLQIIGNPFLEYIDSLLINIIQV